jgi:hypothetical protein
MKTIKKCPRCGLANKFTASTCADRHCEASLANVNPGFARDEDLKAARKRLQEQVRERPQAQDWQASAPHLNAEPANAQTRMAAARTAEAKLSLLPFAQASVMNFFRSDAPEIQQLRSQIATALASALLLLLLAWGTWEFDHRLFMDSLNSVGRKQLAVFLAIMLVWLLLCALTVLAGILWIFLAAAFYRSLKQAQMPVWRSAKLPQFLQQLAWFFIENIKDQVRILSAVTEPWVVRTFSKYFPRSIGYGAIWIAGAIAIAVLEFIIMRSAVLS